MNFIQHAVELVGKRERQVLWRPVCMLQRGDIDLPHCAVQIRQRLQRELTDQGSGVRGLLSLSTLLITGVIIVIVLT